MTDVGLQLIESLYQQLMIDEEWSVRRERGFTWWSYRLAQHVEVGPPTWSIDRHVCPVRIWTEVLRDVDPGTDPARVLGTINMQATLNALVWDPQTAMISEHCATNIHDEIFGWMSKVLATAMVLQNTSAHGRADGLAALCGGVPATSDHPSSGERPDMDEMLGVPANVVAREGAAPSRFAGPQMAHMQKFLAHMGLPGSADTAGVTFEVPFTADRPETALVQLFSDVAHPEAGSGLFTLTLLPVRVEPDQMAALANELNAAEAQGESQTPLLGAWCPDPNSETTLAFCSFVPNLLSRLMLVENVIAYAASRVRFATERVTG
ncbi:hypothetical protein KIH27_18035 [Mycobacterium sp. M1]|uniref:Uncharacterized protein n=1 Tax=Mycolicibacter acidiphilus TaxID=2835306 RepID=A0ABS5RRA3_9MYCO|nr:hypothetical protein [Mycolicibacter acidiphilus]MBS9535489.1 hypothetical protein [Mycolicibacter acidiphilus]